MPEKPRENLLKKKRVKLWNANQVNGFRVRNANFALNSKMKKTLKYNKDIAQRFTANLVEDCDRKFSDKLYSDSYIRELLAVVDKSLTLKTKYEVDLKGCLFKKCRTQS